MKRRWGGEPREPDGKYSSLQEEDVYLDIIMNWNCISFDVVSMQSGCSVLSDAAVPDGSTIGFLSSFFSRFWQIAGSTYRGGLLYGGVNKVSFGFGE